MALGIEKCPECGAKVYEGESCSSCEYRDETVDAILRTWIPEEVEVLYRDEDGVEVEVCGEGRDIFGCPMEATARLYLYFDDLGEVAKGGLTDEALEEWDVGFEAEEVGAVDLWVSDRDHERAWKLEALRRIIPLCAEAVLKHFDR